MTSQLPAISTGSQPLHTRLKIALGALLDSGEYIHNQRIPSESAIALRYQVSRHVVRQALERLVAEGRLKPRQGAGYFVNDRRVHVTLPSFARFTDLLRSADPQATVETVERSYVEAPPLVCAELGVTSRKKLLRIVRVGMIDSEPAAVLEGFYASHAAKYLSDGDLGDGVYALLSKQGLLPVSGENQLRVSFAEGEQATRLRVPSGSAVMEVASTARDSHGQPIEFVRSVYRADRFVFQYHSLSTVEIGAK